MDSTIDEYTLKRFEYSIDTLTPCKFLMNRDYNVMEHLNRLNNTCFQGVLILNVVEIETISMSRVVHSNHTGICTLNIIFKANVMYLVENDIVDLVKIVIEDGHIYGKHPHATITLIKNNTLKPMKKDQVIPVRLGDMQRYNTCNTTFTSNGMVLVCDTAFEYYHLKGVLSEIERDRLLHIITLIKKFNININYTASKLSTSIVEKIANDPTTITRDIILYLLHSSTTYDIPTTAVSLESLLNTSEFDVIVYKDIKIPQETMLVQTTTEVSQDIIPTIVSPFKGMHVLLMKTINIVKHIDTITTFYKKTEPQEYANLFNTWMASKPI
jgi:hypothetical protein